MFYYCLSHSSGGAFVEQIGFEEVLFVQKVYIMSTNEDLYAPVDLGWLILLTLCRGRSAKTPFLWVIILGLSSC